MWLNQWIALHIYNAVSAILYCIQYIFMYKSICFVFFIRNCSRLIFVFITLALYLFGLWIIWSLWVSYYCLMPGVQYSCYIKAWSCVRIIFQWYDNAIRFIVDQLYTLDLNSASSHNSPSVDMPHTSDTLSSFPANGVLSGETVHSNETLYMYCCCFWLFNCLVHVHFFYKWVDSHTNYRLQS
jgi:hypothetical protein